MKLYDIAIIGAGAAGLSAAAVAVRQNKSVLILDMGDKPARKVLASGGGKCNITNTAASADRYFGNNKNFVRGALSRVTPYDILQWCESHKLNLYEKTPGRYFCADGAAAVVDALRSDAQMASFVYKTNVLSLTKSNDLFSISTDNGNYNAKSVIIATGGISFGTLGVSDAGYKIAKSFGHQIIPVRPALCAIKTKRFDSELSGISIPVEIHVENESINDDMLFTHFGIGGPAVYRATVRDISAGIIINMCPGKDIVKILKQAKQTNGRNLISTVLAQHLPMRLVRFIIGDKNRNIADFRDTEIKDIASQIQACTIECSDIVLHNMNSAEIVRGGVSTDKISSKTMESLLCPGLLFAGEVIYVSGDLGGFNLHWAWASGRVAGQNA